MGNKDTHKQNYHAQKIQVDEILRKIQNSNAVILPALLNPKPLMDQEKPNDAKFGAVNEAYELLKICSKYFKRMPMSSKNTMIRFTYPNHEAGKAFPSYPTQFEEWKIGK